MVPGEKKKKAQDSPRQTLEKSNPSASDRLEDASDSRILTNTIRVSSHVALSVRYVGVKCVSFRYAGSLNSRSGMQI